MIREQRLSGRAPFEAVRSNGVMARGKIVRVRAVSRPGQRSRAGIAVHGCKSAVVRNRARRRLRAALGVALLDHPGFDLVVSVKAADAAVAPFGDLRSDLTSTLALAQQLREDHGL